MQQDNQCLIDVLLDILYAAQRIEEYTARMNLADFYEDVKLQDKVIRRLLSISKNAKRISPETRQQANAIAWHTISKIKRQLLEDTAFVDIDQLWSVAKNEIPALVRSLDSQISAPKQPGFSLVGAS